MENKYKVNLPAGGRTSAGGGGGSVKRTLVKKDTYTRAERVAKINKDPSYAELDKRVKKSLTVPGYTADPRGKAAVNNRTKRAKETKELKQFDRDRPGLLKHLRKTEERSARGRKPDSYYK